MCRCHPTNPSYIQKYDEIEWKNRKRSVEMGSTVE
jgi:hypothetical protein